MLEIESKFRLGDSSHSLSNLRTQLTALGATASGVHHEADTYFQAPDRDLAKTDEVFRLRRLGDDQYLTYKGPKIAGPVKARTELEVLVGHGPDHAEKLVALLGHLGYRSVAVIRKRRTTFSLNFAQRQFEICIDDVEQLGHFVELETLAEEHELIQAREAVEALAKQLNLTVHEPHSYLGLLLSLPKNQS